MAGQELELALKIKSAVEGLDQVAKLANEIETLGGDATAVREKAAALAGEFDKLSQQQALIDQFTRLSGAAKTADEALVLAQANTGKLALQFKQAQVGAADLENKLRESRRTLASTFGGGIPGDLAKELGRITEGSEKVRQELIKTRGELKTTLDPAVPQALEEELRRLKRELTSALDPAGAEALESGIQRLERELKAALDPATARALSKEIQRLEDESAKLEAAWADTAKARTEAFKGVPEAKALNAATKDLETGLKAAQKASESLETRFNASRQATRQWADAAQAQRLELQKVGQAMDGAGLDAQKLDVSQARVALGMKEAEKAARALESQARETGAALAQYGAQGAAFEWVKDNAKAAGAALGDTGDAARKAGRAMADAGEQGGAGLFKLKPIVAAIRQELAGLAVGAGLAEFVKGAVDAARQAEMAFLGLQGVAKNTGLDIGTTFNAAGRQAADGLITLTESSKALQNLLLSGFGIDQAVALMGRLKDAASLNRSASMSLGEAVVSVTEGFRTESSELLNNGGIVTNLSAMYEAHAKTLGKSADSLTQAEKAQALFNGVMKDTEPYVGNAEKAAGGLEGALSKLKANVSELQIAFGGDLGPAVQFIAGLLSGLVDIAKHVGVGFNLAGLESAALAKSIGDVYDAVKSGNLDGLGDKIKANFALAHEMAIEAVDRYERGLTPAIQQATDKTQTMGVAGQKAGADVAGGQQQAQTALGETGQAAETVEKQLAKVFEGFKPSASVEDLKAFVAKVNEAGGQGADAGEKVQAAWDKAIASLTGDKLVGFVQSMDVALTNLKLGFQGDSEEAQRLAHLVDTGVRQAITKMGLDANQSLTGVSGKVREGLDDFRAMQQILVSTGAAGDKTGAILVDALQKVADQAQSTDDIDAIRKQAVALGVDGTKAGDIVVQALQRIAAEARTAEDIDRVRKMAVALGADGSASARQLIGVYDALQKATEKVGGAEAGAAKALADSRAEISRMASELTAAEKAQSAASTAADRHAEGQRQLAKASKEVENAANQEGVALTRVYDVMEMATNRIGELNPYLREQVILFQSGAVDAYALEGAFHLIHTTLNSLEADKAKVDGLAASISAAANSGGDLAGAMREAGFSLHATGDTAGEVKKMFIDLDQSQLTGLVSAIDSARAALQGLERDAKSTLSGIQDQIDQMTGNLAGVENRSYESQKADIEAKLKDAQAKGDSAAASTYQEALSQLDTLHALKLRQIAGKREQGGDVQKGKSYLVAEAGNEMFVGDDGTVQMLGDQGAHVWTAPSDGYVMNNRETTEYANHQVMLENGTVGMLLGQIGREGKSISPQDAAGILDWIGTQNTYHGRYALPEWDGATVSEFFILKRDGKGRWVNDGTVYGVYDRVLADFHNRQEAQASQQQNPAPEPVSQAVDTPPTLVASGGYGSGAGQEAQASPQQNPAPGPVSQAVDTPPQQPYQIVDAQGYIHVHPGRPDEKVYDQDRNLIGVGGIPVAPPARPSSPSSLASTRDAQDILSRIQNQIAATNSPGGVTSRDYSGGGQSSPVQATQTIRLELVLPGGRTAYAGMDQANADTLLNSIRLGAYTS